MSKPIYLFKEHENFQVGKTTLQKGAVFGTRLVWIMMALLFSFICFWLGTDALRQVWQYSQTGAETRGTLLTCRHLTNTSGNKKTYVRFEYQIEGQTYSDEDTVSRWPNCLFFPAGSEETVYYLSDNPEVARLEGYVKQNQWYLLLVVGGFGGFGLIASLAMLQKDREEQKHYRNLQQAETILEAMVIKVNPAKDKDSFHSAMYRFQTPDARFIENQIFSYKRYLWPKEIQEGDTLYILYLDDKTYCVL